MREHGEPFPGNRALVIFFAVLNCFQRETSHKPSPRLAPDATWWEAGQRCSTRSCRRCAPLPPTCCACAREWSPRKPGHNFLIAGDQSHLAGANQRIVIVTDVAHAIAFQLQNAVLPLAFGRVILRLGKCGDGHAIFINRVPSTMIEMQMRIDDHVNIFRRHSGFVQAVPAAFPGAEKSFSSFPLACCRCRFRSGYSGSRPNQHGVAAHRDAIEIVGLHLALPERLRHNAEERSAIAHIGPVTDRGQLKIPQ